VDAESILTHLIGLYQEYKVANPWISLVGFTLHTGMARNDFFVSLQKDEICKRNPIANIEK